MAVVPRTSGRTEFTTAVRPVFRSTRGATQEAFGGGQATAGLGSLAQGLDDIAGVAQRQALVIQRRNNDREAKQLDNELTQGILQVGFGNPDDPNSLGYYDARGEDAINQLGKARERITELRQGLLDRASNRVVKQAFEAQSTVRMLREQERMDSHVSTQQSALAEAVGQARIATAVSDAATRFGDPTALSDALMVINGEVMDQADRLGLPDEVAQATLREKRTAAVAAAATAAINREQLGVARRILTENKDIMDGAVHQQLMGKLNEDSSRINGQAAADQLFAQFPGDPARAFAELRKNFSGKTEDIGIAQLAARYSEAKATQAVTQAAAAQAAYEHMILGGQSVASMPDDIKASIDPRDLNQLIGLQANLAGGGGPTETTPEGWMIWDSIMKLPPKEAARVYGTEGLVASRRYMADKEFNQLQAYVREGLNPSAPTPTTRTPTQNFGTFADRDGLIGDQNTPQRGALMAEYLARVDQFQQDNGGRDPSFQQQQELYNDAFTSVEPVARPKGLSGETMTQTLGAFFDENKLSGETRGRPVKRGRVERVITAMADDYRQANGAAPPEPVVDRWLRRIADDKLWDVDLSANDALEYQNRLPRLGMPTPSEIDMMYLKKANVETKDIDFGFFTDENGNRVLRSEFLTDLGTEYRKRNPAAPAINLAVPEDRQLLYNFLVEMARDGTVPKEIKNSVF